MQSDYELAKTFFPGSRKELIISAISLLQTKAGENRIKLSLTMPLSDGKQVGMPGWLGDGYDVICKAESLLMANKWGHDIKEMTLTIFSTDDSPKPATLAVCPLMNSFSLKREAQDEATDELSGVCLQFIAYLNDNTELWSWFRRHYRKSIFVRFETTQQELFDQPAQDTQMSLVEEPEDYEDARRTATSKAHDAEFAGV